MAAFSGIDFAKCIDAYCDIHGISKAELEKHTGISSSNLAQWRAGGKPSKKKVAAFESYVKMPADQFVLLWMENKKTAAPVGDGDSKIIAFLMDLPKDVLRGILLGLGAPADVLSELDQQVPQE